VLYVIGKTNGTGGILLVKAADFNHLKERLTLREDEKILGNFINAEAEAIHSSSFCVVSSG